MENVSAPRHICVRGLRCVRARFILSVSFPRPELSKRFQARRLRIRSGSLAEGSLIQTVLLRGYYLSCFQGSEIFSIGSPFQQHLALKTLAFMRLSDVLGLGLQIFWCRKA